MLLFFPLFLIAYAVTPSPYRNATLLTGSWIFYAWWSPPYLLLLVGLSAMTWVAGLWIEGTAAAPRRKILLIGAIVLMVALLGWFKYANILVETANSMRQWGGAIPVSWRKVVLPIGLSFIVLQAVSYVVDVYRGTVAAQRSFVAFAAYKAMFGQLIAGPIVRYNWVAREMGQRRFDWDGFCSGAWRFMIGMNMKVLVADTLAPVVDLAFVQPSPSFLDAWLGCGAYTLQLFFDFAGYSAMAIGIAQMLGFHFPENFYHPYLARTIQDFWRRWHLSLSSWIRDYLYIPMGGSRLSGTRTYANLLLTMGIAGLWHGGGQLELPAVGPGSWCCIVLRTRLDARRITTSRMDGEVRHASLRHARMDLVSRARHRGRCADVCGAVRPARICAGRRTCSRTSTGACAGWRTGSVRGGMAVGARAIGPKSRCPIDGHWRPMAGTCIYIVLRADRESRRGAIPVFSILTHHGSTAHFTRESDNPFTVLFNSAADRCGHVAISRRGIGNHRLVGFYDRRSASGRSQHSNGT
ncbi:MBOAT family O-acyltransferase [Xylophilus ampelinus]|uniref:MBOAT family O-acyltransferase n=1 Tax=Xylophilus ampelinus TaxID=54067 RepID=UPI001F39224F|nr:MBOAT family O-acyltransferase [Xylophilus ampelinus]